VCEDGLFIPGFVIVFRGDGGRPSRLATSVLFSDGGFRTSFMMCSHSSKVRTHFTGNSLWGKKKITER
jgi:hypothetical protein